MMLFGFVAVFMLGVSMACAAPAPNLSKVEITYVGSDQTGWIPIDQIAKTTLVGQNFYVAVKFTGYPNPSRIFFYQNRVLIPPDKISELYERKGIGNPHIGWVYQFAMPIAYANGIIAVQADGIQGGTHYSTIYGVKSKPSK
jgi:hypothetical protein